ncbi:inositol-1-monophosphatase [Photobacterium swingsii]|uniref:Inositol-1-monophosphatase n=1 Tax=Photobacterium swingsii TaxID=680026 RepID=A0A0J8VF26_9GAMM|nr:inositol monophosphatase family protein [Photobacterium swingsii]KMV31886.1 inositol-1-monophosphatase [Photobacterium swingsii]PSW25533.1 inositol-1-monophosphatase [Photobacterium swingsii]
MQLNRADLEELLQLATQAALAAGEYITQFDRTQLEVESKHVGSSLSAQVVTQVDLDSQAVILSVLASSITQYNLGVLSEENADEAQAAHHERLTSEYFWCIDPLDGTLPFIENTSGYAVSIALVSQSGKPVLGVVFNPPSGDLYQAISDGNNSKVIKNGQPWLTQVSDTLLEQKGKVPAASSAVFTLFIDRSFHQDPRYNPLLEAIAEQLTLVGIHELEIINTSGAVMNAIGVLESAPAAYIKLPKPQKGGGSLWDFSATAAIFEALTQQGLPVVVSNIHGAPLDLNRQDSYYMNHEGIFYSAYLIRMPLIDRFTTI